MRRFQSGGSFSSEPRSKSRASSLDSRAPKGLPFCGAGLLVLLASSILPARAQNALHPLDGLTAPEYWTSYEVLKASGKVNSKTRYTLVQLQEPPKEEVLAWKPGQPMRRQSRVVVM